MKTVILPVAGKGTRLLPLTKATPKELLPIYDKPALQFALDEAADAGARRLVIVNHATKSAIYNYFKFDPMAVEGFRDRQRFTRADVFHLCGTSKDVEIIFVEQPESLGLGHALLCAAPMLLDGPVGVILPDDVILGNSCLKEMVACYQGGHMVAAMEVPRQDVSKYGIFKFNKAQQEVGRIAATGMVEKPTPQQAPSSLAAVGRYILDPIIFDTLKTLKRGTGGEYQLTDAIATDIDRVGLSAMKFSGVRFDCGNRDGLLAAANAREKQVNSVAVYEHAAE